MWNDYDVIDETTADNGTPFRVVLVPDDAALDLDPRGNDGNVGRIVALDTRDGRKWRPREDDPSESHPLAWRANAASIVDAIQDHSFPVVSRWLRVFHGAGVVLPLYEGTDGLATGDPDDQAGADEYRGVTFDTPTTRERGGWPERVEFSTTREHLRMALETDVDEWATWARGDVFGYVIQRGNRDLEYGEIHEWEDEDSVWGFIGEDCAREQGRAALDDFIRAYDTDHPADEPYCNHDAVAVVNGVCECGERVDHPGSDEDDELAYAETAGALPEAVPTR